MLGFYDPQSLTIEHDKASILFINARNADDIHVVEATTPEELDRVKTALSLQKQLKITSIKGDLTRVTGLIIMSRSAPGEGVVQVKGTGNVPFVMDFEAPEGLPEKAMGSILGYPRDGALVVDRIAVLNGEYSPQKTPADPQGVARAN